MLANNGDMRRDQGGIAMAVSLKVNGATRSVPAEPDTPLLYVLRNDLELNGAKFGCGLAQCGACTVLVDGKAVRSCVTDIGSLAGAEITTLEGLGSAEKPHAFQRAFIGEQKPLPGSLNGNRMLDAWIRINADGTATVFTGKVELGQGIVTALAQIAAEELDLPLARISMISGDTGRTPNEGQTAGSQSTENSGTALRLAAAEVRAILIELASARLEMSADSLSVADGVVSAANGKR